MQLKGGEFSGAEQISKDLNKEKRKKVTRNELNQTDLACVLCVFPFIK